MSAHYVLALIAKANAHAIQVKANTEAAAIRAEAEQAAGRAQVALAQVRAQEAQTRAQEAQTAMMIRMMGMIAKKKYIKRERDTGLARSAVGLSMGLS